MGKKLDKFNKYDDFVEKFKPKKTTDDCYTPPEVYDAVLSYVRSTYNIPETVRVIRPFYPDGDYKAENYSQPCIVVDNPPFSIFAQILDFYRTEGIPFFLFAPQLQTFGTVTRRPGLTFISVNITLIYENGAGVNTGFVTNMTPDIVFTTSPKLYSSLKQANVSHKKQARRIEYPSNVFSIKKIAAITHSGHVEFSLGWKDIIPFTQCSKEIKGIYGGGCLISDEKAAEALAAEAQAAAARIPKPIDRYVQLTPHDQELINQLNHAPT